MNILIVGYGNVGKHVWDEFSVLQPDIYDPFIPKHADLCEKIYDVAFVCVPTEALADGRCDISIVENTIRDIQALLFVIKSAIPVGTAEYLADKYNKDIVVSPEYYGTTQHSDDSPNFVVLGGDVSNCRTVAQLYYHVKNGFFKIAFTDAKTAELAKYMENCFLALKVTFCCEFAAVANKYGISYETLREIFIMDERMGPSHTFVLDESPYYDSHCLNKDVPAFLAIASGKAPLIEAMHRINIEKKQGK